MFGHPPPFYCSVQPPASIGPPPLPLLVLQSLIGWWWVPETVGHAKPCHASQWIQTSGILGLVIFLKAAMFPKGPRCAALFLGLA